MATKRTRSPMAEKGARRKAAAQKKADRNAVAEAQAASDALLTSDPVEIKLKPGTTPTLLELRHMSKAADDANRDAARDAANAAARATLDVLRGKMTSGHRMAQRYQRAAMTEVKAQKIESSE